MKFKSWITKSFNDIKHGITSFAHDPEVKSIVNTIHNDVKGIVNFAGKQINKATDIPIRTLEIGSDTARSLGKDATSALSSLSLPLVAGLGVAGVVLFVLVSKK